MLARDVETRDVSAEVKEKESGGGSVFRSLFWVLRRDEEMEGEERERREDVVEDSLEGCREGHEGSWCAMVWSVRGEAWVRILFSILGGA